MTLLAIDPGRSVKEASIGYAMFSRDSGQEIFRGEMTWDELVWRLRCWHIDRPSAPWGLYLTLPNGTEWRITRVVIENFINNTRSRGGQTNGTSEVIGAVEILATQGDVPFTRQPNTILPVAKLHAGYQDTHKHLPHQDAAFLHGYYYLVSKGRLTPKGLASTL